MPWRKIDGVLLLDKPAGMTSNHALQKVKRLFQAAKAGHTGTLDPFATGLLPICLGEATKYSQFLLDAGKTYLAVVRLGIRTTTGDPEGEVLETRPVRVAPADIEPVLARFRGEIDQVPPMHSALKRDGKPLYAYARAGIELARAPRRVGVDALEYLALGDDRLSLRVACGKGLYVRTLAEDIGAALGCGGHLESLRREAVAGFSLAQALTLMQLEGMDMGGREAVLLPVDCLATGLRRLDLDLDAAWQLRHGQAVWRAGLTPGEGLRLYGPGGEFLGVARVDGAGKVAPQRLLADTGGPGSGPGTA